MSEAFKSPQKRRAEPSTLTDHERAILATELAAQDMTIQGRLSTLESDVSAVKSKVSSIESTTNISDALAAFWKNVENVLTDFGVQMFLGVTVLISTIGFCVHSAIVTPASTPAKMCSASEVIYRTGDHDLVRRARVVVTRTNGETFSYTDACVTVVSLDVREEHPKK